MDRIYYFLWGVSYVNNGHLLNIISSLRSICSIAINFPTDVAANASLAYFEILMNGCFISLRRKAMTYKMLLPQNSLAMTGSVEQKLPR